MVVPIELVGFGIVCHKQVQPAIAVVVQQCDAKRFAGGIVQPGLLRNVFECTITPVMEQRSTLTLVCLWGTIRLVFAIKRTVLIGFNRPGDVVCYEQVEFAIVIVVKPDSAG